MRDEDISVLKDKIPKWFDHCKPKTLFVVSPTDEELQIVNNSKGNCAVTAFHKHEWDMRFVAPEHIKGDALLMSNTFFYSDDRKKWIKNMSQSFRYLWIQDLVEGVRGNEGRYLGEDGDSMRFSFKPHWTSDYEHAEDLGELFGTNRILDHYSYSLSSPGRHFAALIDLSASAKDESKEMLYQINEPKDKNELIQLAKKKK